MQPSSIEEAYNRALKASQSLPHPTMQGEVLIAHSGWGEPAARILYTGITHSGGRAVIASSVEASKHILPYRSLDTLIAFTASPRDPRSIILLESASLLGVERITLVSPPLHPAYREKAEEAATQVIEVPQKAPPLLTEALAALEWTPRQLGAREDRIRTEITHLDTALQWVEEYISPGEEYSGYHPAYTPAAKPGALYHCYITGCTPVPLEDALEYPRGYKLLAYMTSVEEQDYRDILAGARPRGLEIKEIMINTDPITAGLYSILAAILVTRRVI